MANPEHLKILKQGVAVWNKWRETNPEVRPDLSEEDFFGTDLTQANLRKVNFYNAELSKARLFGANLTASNLHYAFLRGTDLRGAILDHADLTDADLEQADLRFAKIRSAKLIRTDLSFAYLIETDISHSILESVRIYGVSAWQVIKVGTSQKALIITELYKPKITVDDLEVAQFIYLMLNNQNIRNVIDTITSKVVLILGRFTEERKKILDALKDELRKRNYLPIVFDFEPSQNRNLTETVSILAKMSRFVIADITDPRSIPQELYAIVPTTPLLPIVPIILESQREYGMFESFTVYRSVLPIYRYASQEHLLENIASAIITPAQQKVKELREKTA